MKAFRGHAHIMLSLLSRLAGDVRFLLKKEFFIVMFCSVGSIIAQLAGFITTLRYASSLQKKGAGSFLDSVFPMVNAQQEALIVALAVGALLLLSSFLGYKGRTTSVLVATKYERFNFYRVAGFLGKDNFALGRPYSFADIQVIAHVNSKICGSALRSLFTAIFPSFLFVVSISVALYISFATTILLLFALLFSVPIVYKINVGGLSASGRLANVSSDSGRDKRSLLQRSMVAGEADEKDIASFDLALKSFEDRSKSSEKTKSTIQSFIAFSFVFLILYIGISADAGELQFEYILGYFLALRFGMNSLVALFAIVSGFSLLSIKVKEYFDLLDAFSGKIEDDFSEEDAELPLAFVASAELDQIELAYLHTFLALKSDYIYLDKVQIVEIKSWFESASDDKRAKYKAWLDGVDSSLFDADWAGLSESQLFLLKTAYVCAINPSSIYVDQNALASLPNKERQYAKTFIREANVIYIYDIKALKTLRHGESFVIGFGEYSAVYCTAEEYSNNTAYWNKIFEGKARDKTRSAVTSIEEEEYL
jgi:hypothetical protein